MSDASATHGAQGHDHGDEAAHLAHYWKIYVTLLVLFIVSVAGPVLNDHLIHYKPFLLFTAFGIALVKAYLVCAHFMHLNVEKKFIIYLLTTALVFMGLFYAGVSPDIMEHRGRNWENVAAKQEVEEKLKEHALHPDGEEHEGAPGEQQGAGEHATEHAE
jgi:caa(3)-type oxidase subunit IV